MRLSDFPKVAQPREVALAKHTHWSSPFILGEGDWEAARDAVTHRVLNLGAGWPAVC